MSRSAGPSAGLKSGWHRYLVSQRSPLRRIEDVGGLAEEDTVDGCGSGRNPQSSRGLLG